MPMMGFNYLGLIMHLGVLYVSVLVFWRAAGMEGRGDRVLEFVWSGMSAIVFLASWLILGLSWPGLIGGQVLLLVGIGVFRTAAYLWRANE